MLNSDATEVASNIPGAELSFGEIRSLVEITNMEHFLKTLIDQSDEHLIREKEIYYE